MSFFRWGLVGHVSKTDVNGGGQAGTVANWRTDVDGGELTN